MGVLGTGHNEAWIYDRTGTKPIVPLENTNSLQWGRKMNSISEASVNVMTGSHGDCCSVLGNIGTWGHSLVMFRDGVRSWEGPITNIVWRRGGVSIGAHDVLGWTMKRLTGAVLSTTLIYAVNEMFNDVGRAFFGDDPNILTHRTILGISTGPQVTRDVKLYGGYWDDQLQEMVKAGANFTTIGRRSIFWPSTTIIGKGAPLVPADHMTGDVEVEEDGMSLAAGVVAANDKGVAGIGTGSAVDPFYGQVEELVSSSQLTVASLATAATQWRETHYPAPLKVNVPAGSVLSCDAPYDIEELVCGTLIQVKVDGGLCKRMEDTQQLSEVSVSDGSEGEKVAITLVPVSGVLT